MGGIGTDYDSAFGPDCQYDDDDDAADDGDKENNYDNRKPIYGGNDDGSGDNTYNDVYKPQRRIKTRGKSFDPFFCA